MSESLYYCKWCNKAEWLEWSSEKECTTCWEKLVII